MGQVIQLYTVRNWDADEQACLHRLREISRSRFGELNSHDLTIEEGQTDEGDPWVSLQNKKLNTLWSITKATEPRRSYYVACNNVTDELHTVNRLEDLSELLFGPPESPACQPGL
ncbi:MAG: hypothetical protein HOM51_07410 [Rhodospirillaceae bacterium]|nr:hypothetical protein [Rhodospirillaceae bacterium]